MIFYAKSNQEITASKAAITYYARILSEYHRPNPQSIYKTGREVRLDQSGAIRPTLGIRKHLPGWPRRRYVPLWEHE
jgi:hypothetical protein